MCKQHNTNLERLEEVRNRSAREELQAQSEESAFLFAAMEMFLHQTPLETVHSSWCTTVFLTPFINQKYPGVDQGSCRSYTNFLI